MPFKEADYFYAHILNHIPWFTTAPILPTLKTMTILWDDHPNDVQHSWYFFQVICCSGFISVTFTVISLAIGLGIAALGSNNIEEARFDASISLLIAVVLVLVLSTCGYLLIDPIFLYSVGEQLPLIHEYISIWF